MVIPLPLAELSAHFLGYSVRIIEYKPRRRGHFAKCVGGLSLIGFPLCMWAGITAEWQWVGPAGIYFLLIAICGHVLEGIENQECLLEIAASNEDDWREPNVLYLEEAREMHF